MEMRKLRMVSSQITYVHFEMQFVKYPKINACFNAPVYADSQ